MPLDAGVLAAIRAHVGTEPDDSTLETSYARLGTVEKVAHEIIATRLADLLARPASLTVEGDFAENWTANLKALETKERELAAAVASCGPAGVVQVSRLTRGGARR